MTEILKLDFFNIKNEIKRFYYFIYKEVDTYFLIDKTYPHQDATVDKFSKGFLCNIHNWSFDFKGNLKNKTNIGLKKYKLINEDFKKLNSKSSATVNNNKNIELKNKLELKLYSHAVLEIKYSNSSIIFNPWIYEMMQLYI